jgi:uridine kinase
MITLIAGPSGSGKTTLAQYLAKKTPSVIVPLDDFYFGRDEKPRISSVGIWGNDPDYCDVDELIKVVTTLKEGKGVTSPQYSFLTEDRTKPRFIEPKDEIIVEGLWTLNFPVLRELADQKIYLEVPYDIRLERRQNRDLQRGRSKEISHSIANEVDSMGRIHVEPYKEFANIIIETSPEGLTSVRRNR